MFPHIIHFAIFLSLYIIGAFSTTDILRLLNGSTTSISSSDCFCPVCGNKIPLCDQIPVFSYLIHHGKCRFCNSKIPLSELFSELLVFISLSLICIFSDFSYYGLFLCFMVYQAIKICYLLKKGPRKENFLKNLTLSLLHNITLFGFLAVLFFIEHLTF